MLKYASKFFFEKIMPSVVATVTGAYIVNHYIVRPADTPPIAAAAVAAGSNNSEAGVRAKGISEKAVAKAPVEKVRPETAAEKSDEKRAETASVPADAKKHQTARREKAATKVTAAPAQTASLQDDLPYANSLARAAIDRLRSANETPVRPEAARSLGERPRQDADRQPVESTSQRSQQVTRAGFPPAVQPLPPAIQVSAPAAETAVPDVTGTAGEPRFNRNDGARPPVPPADIPQAPPLDLEVNAAPELPAHATVADDMLSAAKSVVQAVLPR